jgi:four helix bundle protein
MCRRYPMARGRRWCDIFDFGFLIFDWARSCERSRVQTADGCDGPASLETRGSIAFDDCGKDRWHAIGKSSTSVAANYRSACRAGSAAAFRHKLTIAEEECDEVAFWIEFAVDAELIDRARTKELLAEAYEIVAMLVASRKTSLRRQR